MPTILVSWIGNTDLRAPQDENAIGPGPIASACASRVFDKVVLLSDFPEEQISSYRDWLKRRLHGDLEVFLKSLSGPTNFGEIYQAARDVVGSLLKGHTPAPELVFHLSPGTPAMAAVWIILGKTRFPAELIESSHRQGVRTVSFPFDLAADFIPDLLSSSDKRLERLSAADPPDSAEFADIIHRSHVMKRAIEKARVVAPRSVPVLLEGESGTGKELFARAIHMASPRRDKPFVPVNCGAIPAELVESELFGHEKGAFTGASEARAGYFETADGSSLFLDEVGELPLPAQVKLLRAIQEGEIRRLGGKHSKKVNVRIIAATNRNLVDEISDGRFRADLFYRLAVAVIKLPPLRDREGDISLLVGRLMEQVNAESSTDPGYRHKVLSAGAKKLLLRYRWPGNVRELLNTLRRAAIWSRSEEIREDDIADAILPNASPQHLDILERPLGNDLKLQEVMETVARHYLERALQEAGGNKTIAAKLLGLPSYQTFTNWLNRYHVRSGKGRA